MRARRVPLTVAVCEVDPADSGVSIGQCPAQGQIVLVYEERGGHEALRGYRALLLLVGHRGADLALRKVVARGDDP